MNELRIKTRCDYGEGGTHDVVVTYDRNLTVLSINGCDTRMTGAVEALASEPPITCRITIEVLREWLKADIHDGGDRVLDCSSCSAPVVPLDRFQSRCRNCGLNITTTAKNDVWGRLRDVVHEKRRLRWFSQAVPSFRPCPKTKTEALSA